MSPLEAGAATENCRLVPIVPADPMPPLRLCALVQPGAKPDIPASLILLGSNLLGRAYAGALADAADRVHAWLEIWVQTTTDCPALDEREAGTNPEADARWKRWVSGRAGDEMQVVTGWETAHPRPVWLSLTGAPAVVPRDAASGDYYELCIDDTVLLMAGLEPFGETRRRFLAVKGKPGAGLLATTGEVPPGVRSAKDVLPGGGAGLVPFNPEGGFIFVRRLAPLDWDQYAGLLSNRPFQGLSAGRPPVKLGGPYAGLEDWDRLQQSGAHLFSTTRGRSGRFHETFHLKLLLLQSMLREVRAAIAASQLPLLNLNPGAFRVDLSAAAGALPVLWTARAILTGPSSAVPLTAPGELRYFKSAEGNSASIYRPEGTGRPVSSRGELRIRKILTTGGRIQVEATLASPEVTRASPRDLVWVRLPLPGTGALDLVGSIDAADALAQGEARFRTAPLELRPPVLAALQPTEGGVFPGTPFETIPMLSTPVDLYGLGVLGVQLFLTGAGKPLPAAIDELLSLVRAVDAAGLSGKPGEKFMRTAALDARWGGSLGPQHHGHDAASNADVASLLPVELWWDVLAILGRFFAGAGQDSYCRDFGDAPVYQLEAALDAPLADVEALVLRSRSLLLCDWPSNREVARVIQTLR
ncbi:MAG TPA: hypothetical protein VG734_03175 [Lacunisphaera sp.]|nr:hypothetical protein [Lacunisphaera sp.]